jgi:hypothetical protein
MRFAPWRKAGFGVVRQGKHAVVGALDERSVGPLVVEVR